MKDSGAGNQLATQAKYWEGQNRYDLARENWLKLLRSSPDNAAALAGLVNAEAVSGRAAAAQVYFDRLKEAHPDSPDLAHLQGLIRQGAVNQDQLSAPRALARQGKYQEAVDAYRAMFGKEIPGGRLALEYYQTLAGTETGWEPARAGISKLVDENPNQPIYKLALAQHLTYREPSRRQGIAELAAMATSDNTVSGPARQAWRQGLLWLGVKPGDEPLYQDYLKRFGADAQVSARLATLRTAAPAAALSGTSPAREPTREELRGSLVRQGFEALDRSQLDIASERFSTAISQYGESADALGGLGIIRLRQQDYSQAKSLLERATTKDQGNSARWKEALSTARFWDSVRDAETAHKAGDSRAAEKALRTAIAADPKRAASETSVSVSLADLLAEQGQMGESEKIYRDVLRRKPDDVDALRGLIGVLTRSKRLPEALALAERAPENVRNQLGSFGVLKAQGLREQASVALQARDERRAEGLLKQALLLDPESPWTRLDLARIYQRQGRSREAGTLVDSMLTSNSGPVQPDVIYIKASLLAEQQDFIGGLQVLEQVPPGSRTTDMAVLQKRLWVQYQAQRAGVYSRAGAPQEAQSILDQIEPFVGEMPELLGAMATAYADLGDEPRALRYMRQALARNRQPDAGLRLAYASLLFKLRQDTEFEVVMDDLLRRRDLTEQQNLDVANLRIGYRLRQADVVREEGDLARAYEYLEPLIRVNPNDPRLMMALARLYDDSKDSDKSYLIYQRVLQQNPNEIDAYKGAIGAALSLNRLDDADSLLARAFEVEPNNARLYALAGRAAKARGDDGRALGLYQQALRMDAEQNTQSNGFMPTGSGNSQPLLQLIDPASSYLRAPPRVTGEVLRPAATSPIVTSGGFYKMRATLPASRRMAATTAASQRPAWLIRAKVREAAVLAARPLLGDVAISARMLGRPRFIKVSTPPQSGTATPAQGSVDQPSGYWAEQPKLTTGSRPSYKYVDTSKPVQRKREPAALPVTQETPEIYTSDFPQPRRVSPAMSQTLSGSGDSSRYQPAYGSPQPLMPATTTQQAPRATVISNDPVLATPAFATNYNQVETPERRLLLKDINELRANRTPYAEAGLALRSRDGSPGLDRLYDIETPVEVAIPAGESGRIKLRAVPVYLDAGTVSGRNLPVYGGLGLALAQGIGTSGLRYDSSETGVAVGLGYEVGSFKADIGSSPLGFPVETLVGGLNWRPKFDRVSLKLDLSRRTVTDSLLSYAGVRDPATGLTYGGVTKTGGRADVAYDLGRYGIYGNAGYAIYDGQNVPRNSSVEIGAGVYARAVETRTSRINYGLNLTTFGYDKNLRRFSLGHGGYFSPQSYVALSVPVEFEGFHNRLSYKLGGALGLQAFKEDAQSQYPNDEGLQSALTTALQTYNGDLPIPGGYPSKRQTGVGFTLAGQAEYLLDPNLALGGRVSLDNARDYNEATALAYLRYMFYPQNRVSFPPNLLAPYFNFGDPRQ